MTKTKKMTTYQMATAALMAAVMCILGPMSVPIGPVPISLTNLVIYFALYLIGSKYGTVSYLVYLLLGAVGLPVFSGFTGGFAKLAGPTGGYLIGFIPMAIIGGLMIEKSHGKKLPSILGMVLGTLVDYLFGTLWFVVVMKCGFWYALTVCVIPFLIGDGIKIVLAAVFGSLLRARLVQAGLLREQAQKLTGEAAK
jgi:biotin transport system substrate-specific component